MPELPDLVYLEKELTKILVGRKITAISVKEPIILRVLLQQSLDEALVGLKFKKVYRHGPFLGFKFDSEIEMVIHPMLAGKFKLVPPKGRPGRAVCTSLLLDDGQTLNYLDDKKMGKIYFIPAGQYEQIPRFSQQGVNIVSREFTLEKFQSLIAKQRKQVRVFLMNQTLLSAIGNAYADEILFDAGLHPKTLCSQLGEPEISKLHESICTVIQWGITEVENAQQPIEVKVREHVKVRNRKDQPCPNCGTAIRRAGVLGHDTFFCPKCQPPTTKQFITWN